MSDGSGSDTDPSNNGESPRHSEDGPLEPSRIAQYIEHDRCRRFLKQSVDPGDEPDAREWLEAFGLMNVALLGNGWEFENTQIEALAANATKVIAPELDDIEKTGVPDIDVDETWGASARGQTEQLRSAVAAASDLQATSADDQPPYVLLYQVPLEGTIDGEAVYGDADCLVVAPAEAVRTQHQQTPTTSEDAEATSEAVAQVPEPHSVDDVPSDVDVVARVIECKSAREQQRSHRVQVAMYAMLLEQLLAEGATTVTCHVETSVLTQATAAAPGESLSPFELSTFRRAAWELVVTQLFADGGSIEDALADDLESTLFSIDQVCNNCSYREACATRAVEAPRDPASLALLGFDASVQRSLRDAGITSLHELATLTPPLTNTQPTDTPPTLELEPDLRRTLEEALPDPVYETVLRAQSLYSNVEPSGPEYQYPPAIPGTDWVPLPDDRCRGWGNVDSAAPGELIHVAVFVRPDTAIDRVAALGACVYADAHEESITIGEVIDAVPDDADLATDVEEALFERFLEQVFDAIERVATALGDPEQAVMHWYTYSDYALEALTEGLERHRDSLDTATTVRALCSLDEDAHTSVDQAMVTAVQPAINEHFALGYPSQGLLAVVDQFIPKWTVETFDPLDARGDAPPLRAIFREQFLNDRVPYLNADPGLRMHLARGPLAEGPASDVVETATSDPDPDGWYPIRKRAGGQFPLEYIWAVVPEHPDDATPRLTPDVVEEWAIDDDDEPLYKQEINRFYYRTDKQAESLQRTDVEFLLERLSYALLRLVEAIPFKDAYLSKVPVDATNLTDFELPVRRLPEAARDYLHMEFGTRRDTTIAQYRHSRRDRARSGRSVPIRCTDIEQHPDDSLTIEGELAYDALFDDEDTAAEVAQQTRLRSGDGPGGGSWRVITRLPTATPTPTSDDADVETPPETPSARGRSDTTHDTSDDTHDTHSSDAGSDSDTSDDGDTDGHDDDADGDGDGDGVVDTAGDSDSSDAIDVAPSRGPTTDDDPDPETAIDVADPEAIKHSPPVLVEEINAQTGDITLTAFPHRFKRNGSSFRVDHCGWDSPAGSNLATPHEPPAERPGYVAGRDPVWIDTDEVYMLDPMVDDFGAPKSDRALLPHTVKANALYQHLQAIQETGQQQAALVASQDDVDTFIDTMTDADQCLTPNEDQQSFIRAVDRAVVPLQGPPGTGKTGGATAPALLARAHARTQRDKSFIGVVVAPSHEAVDAALNGVVDCLNNWRDATNGLSNLQLVRVLPSTPPTRDDRADATADHVDITYANYHSTTGETTLKNLATNVLDTTPDADENTDENEDQTDETESTEHGTTEAATGDGEGENEDESEGTNDDDAGGPHQCLVFATPTTLYQTLGIIAETLPDIDGDTAPAAMRHPDGLADVVCIDEASMLDMPRLLLAGSALKPTGQTLLVGDTRQLATVTETDWKDTRRKPLKDTQAYQSALDYVNWLNTTITTPEDSTPTQPTDGGTHQTQLSGFNDPRDPSSAGGDDQ